MKHKRFYLKTYGCQMNVHDSERITGMMEECDLIRTDDSDDADVVVINTCAVREKPERKLFAELGRWKKIKRNNPELILVVSGCMAPRDADQIRRQAPYVDLLIGPRSIHRLPDLVQKIAQQRKPIDAIDLHDNPTPLTPVHRGSAISGWVDVMYGCDYKCSYCAVPSARGKEISRIPSEIFAEIDELKSLGYKEITLLGQTVNGYGRSFHYCHPEEPTCRDKIDFAWLLKEIDRRASGMRLRFTSPHPQLFNPHLIETIAELPTVCEHIHLPLQSADGDVLRRMKRSYIYEKYLQIVEQLRNLIPDIAITTDIIVAFPGETDEQFQKTVDAYRQIEFDQAFMFIYSPRRHTEALKFFDDEIPKEIAQGRLEELITVANDIAGRKNRRLVGQSFEVLVEGPSHKRPDRLTGRTRTNKIVVFDGSHGLIGRFVNVRTEKAYLWGFEGVLSAN